MKKIGQVQKRTIGFCLVIFFLMAGCATVSPKEGLRLAETGAATANTTRSVIVETQTDLERYIQGMYLQSALRGTNPPDYVPNGQKTSVLEQVDRIIPMLQARESVLTSLAEAYDSFEILSSGSREEDVKSAVTALGGSINKYASVVDPNEAATISESMIDLAAKIAGVLARAAHSRQLRLASEVIKEQVITFHTLLLKEQEALTELRKDIVYVNGETAKALWKHYIGRPHPILRQQLEDFGLDYDEKQVNDLMTIYATLHLKKIAGSMAPEEANLYEYSKRFYDGILNVITRRVQQQEALQEKIITQTVAAIQALINAHDKYEAGASLTLTSLAGCLQEIEEISTLIAQIRSEYAQASAEADNSGSDDEPIEVKIKRWIELLQIISTIG